MKLIHSVSLPSYINAKQETADSFGGSQNWFPTTGSFRDRMIHRGGCGLVAVCDFTLYYSLKHGRVLSGMPNQYLSDSEYCLDRKTYMHYLRNTSIIKYPLLPKFGSFSFQVLFFLNRYLQRMGVSKRVTFSWSPFRKTRLMKLYDSLCEGNPAILLIGPQLFGRRRSRGLTFYQVKGDAYVPASLHVSRHFVTITGIEVPDDSSLPVFLEISSWGKKFYIDFEELSSYTTKSLPIFTGFFYMK